MEEQFETTRRLDRRLECLRLAIALASMPEVRFEPKAGGSDPTGDIIESAERMAKFVEGDNG